MNHAAITEQRIRELAYSLWEAAGKPEGSANRFWAEAERRLKEEMPESRPDGRARL